MSDSSPSDDQVERALMAFLDKPHDPFPHKDWLVSREAPISWWRTRMRIALQALTTPPSEQGKID